MGVANLVSVKFSYAQHEARTEIFEKPSHKLILKYCLKKQTNQQFVFVWDSLQDRIVPLANRQSQRFEFTLKEQNFSGLN